MEVDHNSSFLNKQLIQDHETGKLSSTWYFKPTDTGLMNCHAQAPKRYKLGKIDCSYYYVLLDSKVFKFFKYIFHEQEIKFQLLLQVKIIYARNHVDLSGNSSFLNPAFSNHSLIFRFIPWIYLSYSLRVQFVSVLAIGTSFLLFVIHLPFCICLVPHIRPNVSCFIFFTLYCIWLQSTLMTSYRLYTAIWDVQFQYSSACRFKIPCLVWHSCMCISIKLLCFKLFLIPHQIFICICICCTAFLQLNFSTLVSSFAVVMSVSIAQLYSERNIICSAVFEIK